MSELASAMFSIADANEFRFARFYIVCEEVPLGTPESPPIVSGVSDMRPPGVQTWKRHGIRCSHPAGRNTHIFLQRMFHMQFHPKSASCASCNITYHSKARYAYCDNPFSVFLLFVSFSYTIEGKASIYEERLLIV